MSLSLNNNHLFLQASSVVFHLVGALSDLRMQEMRAEKVFCSLRIWSINGFEMVFLLGGINAMFSSEVD